MISKSTIIAWIAGNFVVAFTSSLPAQTTHAASPPLFERLVADARASATKEYKEAAIRLPSFLKDLSYDAYMDIHARREKALWHRDGRFEIQFFHPGYLYQSPVGIRSVENGHEHEIKFDPAMFDYGQNKFPPTSAP